jgi:hypothetical protein
MSQIRNTSSKNTSLERVLWIRNDLVRILPLKSDLLNNWHILSLHNGSAPPIYFFGKIFYDLEGHVFVIKDDLEHFEEKFATTLQIF